MLARFLAKSFPDAVFIAVVREARDVVASNVHGFGNPRSVGNWFWQAAVTAVYEKIIVRNNLFVIRYEDFKDRHDDTVRAIARRLELGDAQVPAPAFARNTSYQGADAQPHVVAAYRHCLRASRGTDLASQLGRSSGEPLARPQIRRHAAKMVFPAWLAHDNEWQVAVGTAVERLALLMPSFRGGGAERVMLTLAGGFADQGLAVDLLVAQMEGAYVSEVPATVRTIDLRASRVLAATVPLLRYLRAERPRALASALSHMNVVAIWARAVARVETRLVVSERNLAGLWLEHAVQRRARFMPTLMRRTYGGAMRLSPRRIGLADTSRPRCTAIARASPVSTTRS